MSTPHNNGTNYIRRDVGQPDSRTAGQPERITNTVLEAGVQTRYVHSSINRTAHEPIGSVAPTHYAFFAADLLVCGRSSSAVSLSEPGGGDVSN